MDSGHTPPLVPADADLTDFQFMPLQVARLRKSKAWLICKRRPELAFYMVNLWTAAWHERPAGSLEDDDDVLADLAMCSPEKWDKVRDAVLRGWVKCSDGRLYHPVVAEKALEAWKSKIIHAYDRECGRLRKAATRSGAKDFMPPTLEEWSQVQASGGQFILSDGRVTISRGQLQDKGGTSHKCPPENSLKGEGQGEGQGQGEGHIGDKIVRRTDDGHGETPRALELTEAEHHQRFERLQAKYPEYTGRQNWIATELACRRLIETGEGTWDDFEAGVDRLAAYVEAGGYSSPKYVPTPLNFFTGADKPWLQPWTPPPTKDEQRVARNIDETEQWLRERRGANAT